MKNGTFQGFRFPTTTPIPDELFDELMAELSGAELKVLLYICRRTFGFKKVSDTISLNQIASGIVTKEGKVLDRGTGLSKRHVQRALKSLESKQAVKVHRQMDEQGLNEINTYTLNFIEGVETKSPYGRDKMYPRVETAMSPTTYSKQQTVRQQRNNNVRQSLVKTEDKDKVEYFAEQLADKLNDRKSLSFYRIACRKHDPHLLLRKAAEIVRDGGARKPGAVFVHWLQSLSVD